MFTFEKHLFKRTLCFVHLHCSFSFNVILRENWSDYFVAFINVLKLISSDTIEPFNSLPQ